MTFRRWTLRALMNGPDLQGLLKDVALRLEANQNVIQQWKIRKPDKISTALLMKPFGGTSSPSYEHDTKKSQKAIENIMRLHTDTRELALHVSLLSSPPTHVIGTTARQLRDRHQRTIESVAELVVGLRTHQIELPFVDTFLRQRLGIPLLCEHVLEIIKDKPYGTIDVDVPLKDMITDGVAEAKILTEAHYELVPDVQVSDTDIRVTLHRPWLHYVLVELLKNAFTATIENKQHHVHIHCDEDETFASIYVDDNGGGLTDESKDLFAFAQTEKVWDRLEDQTTYAMVRSPLKGLGVGLAQSKMIMQHFGGDLHLENFRDGCRATVQIRKDLDFPEQI